MSGYITPPPPTGPQTYTHEPSESRIKQYETLAKQRAQIVEELLKCIDISDPIECCVKKSFILAKDGIESSVFTGTCGFDAEEGILKFGHVTVQLQDIPKTGHVLDIGSANGNFIEQLAVACPKTNFFGISAHPFENRYYDTDHYLSNVHLKLMDFHDIDLPSLPKFDFICSTKTMMHSCHPVMALEKILNKLKPGGVFCCDGIFNKDQISRDSVNKIITQITAMGYDVEVSEMVAPEVTRDYFQDDHMVLQGLKITKHSAESGLISFSSLFDMHVTERAYGGNFVVYS